MYITISDVIGNKTIDLSYPIRGIEVTVVSLFSDNIQYEFTVPWMAELGSWNKRIEAKTYTR